jgi:hypothetical protein
MPQVSPCLPRLLSSALCLMDELFIHPSSDSSGLKPIKRNIISNFTFAFSRHISTHISTLLTYSVCLPPHHAHLRSIDTSYIPPPLFASKVQGLIVSSDHAGPSSRLRGTPNVVASCITWRNIPAKGRCALRTKQNARTSSNVLDETQFQPTVQLARLPPMDSALVTLTCSVIRIGQIQN